LLPLAEGFTEAEQNLWLEKADELALARFDYEPFSALDCELAINVWRVDVAPAEYSARSTSTSCRHRRGRGQSSEVGCDPRRDQLTPDRGIKPKKISALTTASPLEIGSAACRAASSAR
jgi:hypothetical protein